MRKRRFKDQKLQLAYERGLADGKSWSKGSGNGARFWKGYDMVKNGIVLDAYPRGTPAYAYWAAGQDVARSEANA